MTLGFIILGLLSYNPMTGYDLKAFFDRSINFFWSAELSQIYRELSRLEKLGYINYRIEHQEGRPDKKIYSLSVEGERAFVDWLRNIPEKLTPVSRNEFLIRIFFSSKLKKEELIEYLNVYIKEQEEELNTYIFIEEKLKEMMEQEKYRREAFFQRLTVKRGQSFARSEIEWAKDCIREIEGFNY